MHVIQIALRLFSRAKYISKNKPTCKCVGRPYGGEGTLSYDQLLPSTSHSPAAGKKAIGLVPFTHSRMHTKSDFAYFYLSWNLASRQGKSKLLSDCTMAYRNQRAVTIDHIIETLSKMTPTLFEKKKKTLLRNKSSILQPQVHST